MKIPAFWSRVAFATGVIVVSAAWLMRPLDRSVLIPVTFRSGRFGVLKEQGYINLQGREIFDQRWENVGNFSQDAAYVSTDQLTEGRWIDRNGRQVTSDGLPNGTPDYMAAAIHYAQSYPRIRGYADAQGKLKYPIAWEMLPREIELVPVRQGQLWGYMNRSSEWIVSPQYSEASVFQRDGTAVVGSDGKIGCIDSQGVEIVALRWGSLSTFDPDHLAVACIEGGCGVINREDQIEIPAVWDDIDRCSHGELWSVIQNGRRGVVDRSGRVIVPCAYDEVTTGSDGGVVYLKARFRNQPEQQPQWMNRIKEWIDLNFQTSLMFHEEHAVFDTAGHVIWRSTWWFHSWAWVWIMLASSWIAIDAIASLLQNRLRRS